MPQSPSASGSFTLAVPEAYVRYFKRRIDVLLLLSLAAWLLVFFSHFYGSGRHSISSPVGLISSGPTFILCFWGWQLVRKLPWRHEFDDFTIQIVPGHVLRRTKLGRRVDIVTRWEDTRWNGLPALQIFVEGRYFWHRRTLLMVYSLDDESVVQTRVIPLLATLSAQQRTSLWSLKAMSPENLTIRSGELSDADAVFVLLAQFAVSYQPQRVVFNTLYPSLLASAHGTLLVAEMEGQVVGYTVAIQLPILYANGPIVEIQELMVAPKYRSQGIGTRLVEAVIDQARDVGAVEVTVPSRRAGPYYLQLGFAETATYYKYKIGEIAHAA